VAAAGESESQRRKREGGDDGNKGSMAENGAKIRNRQWHGGEMAVASAAAARGYQYNGVLYGVMKSAWQNQCQRRLSAANAAVIGVAIE